MRRPRTEARPGERMSRVEEGLTNNGPLQKPILFMPGWNLKLTGVAQSVELA